MTHSVGREVIRQQGRLRTAQIKKPQPLLTGVERVPEKDPLGEAMGRQLLGQRPSWQLLATLPEVSVHFAIG